MYTVVWLVWTLYSQCLPTALSSFPIQTSIVWLLYMLCKYMLIKLYTILFQGFSRLAGIHDFGLRGVGGARHRGMVQDRLLCYGRLLCLSPSGGSSVFLYAGSLRLPYIYMATTARDLVHNSRLLLQRVLVLYSCQLSAEGGCRSEDCSDVVSSAYPSHIYRPAT